MARHPHTSLAAFPAVMASVPCRASSPGERRNAVAAWERHCSLADALALFSAKRLSRASAAHPKTAARWRRGESSPSGAAVISMMAADDDLLITLLRAAGRHDFASIIAAEQHMLKAVKHLAERA